MGTYDLSRRGFVRITGTAGAGLVLGVQLTPRLWAQGNVAGALADFQPNVFLGIDTDGAVTIWVGHQEMGQGVLTSLPMLVAEELDADWRRVRAVHAEADSRFGAQMTGGSASVRGSWETLRKAGAAAREMLVEAAAREWGVAAGECSTRDGTVVHEPSGNTLDYGALAEAASQLPVPAEPKLKDASQFRLLRTSAPRTDTPPKVDGSAVFGIDVRVPGMLHATVVHPPRFGATVAGLDGSAAKQVPGVLDVFEVSQGVAVVAEYTWAAFQGAEALDIQWEGGTRMSDAELWEQMEELSHASDAGLGREDGDPGTALDGADTRLSAVYTTPYLAHATMEPMNATADVRANSVELWTPTQDPQTAQRTAAEITGVDVANVRSHVTFLGGGFGRRAEQDFVRDAVECSMHMGRPVQVTWTREEDTRQDFYRPATYHRFEAGLSADGSPVAWTHRIVAASILQRFMGQAPPGGVDFTSIEGAANLPYHVPNIRVDVKQADFGAPVGWWRSVGSSQNAFVTESFVDELAHAAGVDPVEYRRGLLAEHPRHLAVLNEAARRSGWGSPLPEGRARGVAVAESFGSFVAEVAEVSLEDGEVKVHKVTAAIDCGQYVNPDTVEAQVESGIVYGLTAALYGEATLEDGGIVQGNFNDYRMLRMPQMPEVEVQIIESGETPGGVGEPGTPPIAPAVTNALFALTGVRVRSLAIRPETLVADDGADPR